MSSLIDFPVNTYLKWGKFSSDEEYSWDLNEDILKFSFEMKYSHGNFKTFFMWLGLIIIDVIVCVLLMILFCGSISFIDLLFIFKEFSQSFKKVKTRDLSKVN